MLPVLKSPGFWAAQIVIVAIAITHNFLETYSSQFSNLVDFLPVSLFWIPLIYVAARFGFAGTAASSLLLVISNVTNWDYFQRSDTLFQEVFYVIVVILISLFVGHQVDITKEERRRTKDYATLAANRQDEERKRISLEIHDDHVQTLIAACHQIDNFQQKNIPESKELTKLRGTIIDVIHSLRDLSVDLHQPVLDEVGLLPAIQNLSQELGTKGHISVRFSVEGNQFNMSPEIRNTVYRIAQEAFRNIERHSRAKRVDVHFAFKQNHIVLEMIDDGIGFNVKESHNYAAKGHLGLLSMAERAKMQSGRIEISSVPGKGTRVSVFIPIDTQR